MEDRIIHLTMTVSITNNKFFELMNILSERILELPEELEIKLEHIGLGNG